MTMKNIGIIFVLPSLLSVFGLMLNGRLHGQETPPTLDRPPVAGESSSPPARPIPAALILSPLTTLNLICEDTELRERTKITDQQIEDLKKLMIDLGQQQQSIRQKYAGQSPSKETEDKQRQEIVELQRKLMPGIAEILKPEQMMQFHAIYFLIIGGLDSPLANVEMLRFLHLTEEQKTKIDEILKERAVKITELIQQAQKENSGARPTAEDANKIRVQGQEISRSYGEKAREVLTPEQRATEAELQKAKDTLQGKLREFLRRHTAARNS